MDSEEKYFLIIGCVLSVVIGYLVAQHNKTRGYSFGQTFMYGAISLMALVFTFWIWYWEKNGG